MKYWKYVIAGFGLGFIFSGIAASFMLDDDGAFGGTLIQCGTIFQMLFAGITIGESYNEEKHKK
jgi:hypothetical protein